MLLFVNLTINCNVMYELIYVSSAIKKLNEEELNSILVQSRQYNIAHSITGILLYIDGDFLQVLEGKKENIDCLFDKIRRDKRHQGIIVVYEGNKVKRDFPYWAMGFRSTNYETLRDLSGFEELNKRDLLNIEDKTAVSFLKTFIMTHSHKVTFW